MTSTLEDGEPIQQHAEQDDSYTDIQDETVPERLSDTGYFNGDHIEQQISDELPQLDQQDGIQDTEDSTIVEDIDATPASPENDPQSTDVALRVRSPSVDDTASIPDDTPSLQGSAISSPRSDALSLRAPTSKKGGIPPRRPFDLRFSSRLSTSQLGSPRASSPAFLAAHSRQSSLASFAFQSASEPDDSTAPWEVMRWNRLNRLASQVYAEASRRTFGDPTCLAVTDQLVIGTSRGMILIFDHQQNHKAIIGSGTKAAESGSITSLAISADHTTVAAGHATGHIFTWEIGRTSRPFLHIPPIDISQPEARRGDGHVAGSLVLHIGFLGFRRTALISADDRGMAFSHLATRGTGSLGRSVRTTRILGRYPDVLTRGTQATKKSSVLAFAPLPLGNIEKATDTMGLVAMLTPYLLVIVSTTPIAQTQHKAARPKDVTAHGAMTAALAWFPAIKLKGVDTSESRSKLAYAWSNVLTILEIHEAIPVDEVEKEKPPELQFLPRSHYKAEEAIVAVQWLSRSVIAVLTITQQLLIIEDVNMTVTDSFDLLPKDVYHADVYSQQLQAVIENHDEGDTSMHGVVADAYHMSFRAYKGRLFLLGFKGVWWGSLTNWADRLLAMMDSGDFIGSIRLATSYYVGMGEILTIGLPEDADARGALVREKLLEMMVASLKYAFGKNQIAGTQALEETHLMDLAVACVAACLSIDDQDFLFDEVFPWYEDHGHGAMFVDVLEPHILDGKITKLPPSVLKILISHFKNTHSSSSLEEMICLLDPREMDIDQVTTLCKQNGLYDAYIYVWNTALMDYVSPLRDLLNLAIDRSRLNGDKVSNRKDSDVAQKLFAYISFILTSRVYPTGLSMEDAMAYEAKLQIYDFLFSGNNAEDSTTPTSKTFEEADLFPHLRSILSFDTSSFMAVMNEAFEDSFLNTDLDDDMDSINNAARSSIYNRRFIVQVLLVVMSTGFEISDTIYLDMFIARNLPKYPQYMQLSGSTLQETFMRLCRYDDEDLRDDAQLSVEYLLSVYHPADVLSLVSILRKARFYRVLKSIFRLEVQYADLINTYFVDPNDQAGVFQIITECLRDGSQLNSQQRKDVSKTVQDHAADLLTIDIDRTAVVIDQFLPQYHTGFLEAVSSPPSVQFRYLKMLFEPDPTIRHTSENTDSSLIELYVRLMCQYEPTRVVDYIKNVKEGDLKLDAVIPAMEASGVIDAAVILLSKQGQVREAMNRLIKHIETLQAALNGLLENAQESPDAVGTNEAIEDLLESVDRYSGVGLWICQSQTKTSHRQKPSVKSPRKPSAPLPLSFDETLWLDLLVAIVAVSQSLPKPVISSLDESEDEVQKAIRNTIQKAFTALLTNTTATKDGSRTGSDFTFLRILRAFLTRAAESSPSLSELRNVIASIFSAYAYEESLLSLSNSMLNKDLFVHVEEVTQSRQQGWRPRGQICEICRRRVWGPGIGLKVWESWERREDERKQRRHVNISSDSSEDPDLTRGKGKAAVINSNSSTIDEGITSTATTSNTPAEDPPTPLVVFSCRHLYHRKCLIKSQGQDQSPRSERQFPISTSTPSLVQGTGEDRESDEVPLRCPSCV